MKKILPICNILLVVIAIIGSFYFVITRDDELGLILKDSSIIVTITAPYWVEKLFHKKISSVVKFIVIVFIFCAQFLGATVELYNQFEYYDKITHTISGVLTALAAIALLQQWGIYQPKNVAFQILFMIAITLLVAVGWEMFEYTANILFGGDAQRVAKTGVNDTMQDMIVAFLGSIVVSVIYYIEEKTHKTGIVKSFMNGIQKD